MQKASFKMPQDFHFKIDIYGNFELMSTTFLKIIFYKFNYFCVYRLAVEVPLVPPVVWVCSQTRPIVRCTCRPCRTHRPVR